MMESLVKAMSDFILFRTPHSALRTPNSPELRTPRSAISPGFTLIEVMVALSIMAIGLFAVFRLQAQNLELQSEAYFMTMAGQLAKMRTAEIEAKPEEGHSSGDFQNLQPGFLYDADVSRVSGIRDLLKIRVVITEESDRSGRGYAMETFQWVQPR
jgi:prepilin-type N-terminal cleavage/methylation domain-containing protein